MSAAGGALAIIILAGCDLLTNLEYAESLPLPPKIPAAHVMQNGVEILELADYQGGDCQFVLNWQPTYTGVLSADGDYGPLDTEENIEALKLAHLRWVEYQIYMRSDPYYPPVDLPLLNFWRKVDGAYKLKSKSDKDMELVIQRYWPRDLLEKDPPEPLTVASWYTDASNARRKAAFLAAREQMEALMAALKASPFWDVWYMLGTDDRSYPLQDMWDDMRIFISSGDIPEEELYTDPEWADYYDLVIDPHDQGETMVEKWHNVGHLYRFFFGPIPRKDDYVPSTSYYVFPFE
jgi:hypothetical protein